MNRSSIVLLCLVNAVALGAEDFKAEYLNLLHSQKYNALQIHLTDWEKKEPQNPELYIAYFNFHFNIGMRSVQTMGKDSEGRHTIYSKREYDPKHAQAALSYIDTALSLAPNRLDIHFGKIRFLSELQNYKAQKDALIFLLDQSVRNKNAWAWARGVSMTNGESSLFAGIADYLAEWFDNFPVTGTYIKEVAEKEVALYPRNPTGWNLLAGYYRNSGDLQKALDHLHQAEKLDPRDGIVVANIGQTYAELKEVVKAKEYFKKLLTFPDQRLKEFAAGWLTKLGERTEGY